MPRRKFQTASKKAIGEPGSLIAYLPLYYNKAAREHMGNWRVSNSCIESVAKGQRNNPLVREALAWVALEKFFTQMFKKR